MGLGKTVEVLALVLANRAPDENCEEGEREGSGGERGGSGGEREGSGGEGEGSGGEGEGSGGEREKKGENVETEETTSVSDNKPENQQIPGTSRDQPIILEGTSLMNNIAPENFSTIVYSLGSEDC